MPEFNRFQDGSRVGDTGHIAESVSLARIQLIRSNGSGIPHISTEVMFRLHSRW